MTHVIVEREEPVAGFSLGDTATVRLNLDVALTEGDADSLFDVRGVEEVDILVLYKAEADTEMVSVSSLLGVDKNDEVPLFDDRDERVTETDVETRGDNEISGEGLSVNEGRLLADTLFDVVRLFDSRADVDTECDAKSDSDTLGLNALLKEDVSDLMLEVDGNALIVDDAVLDEDEDVVGQDEEVIDIVTDEVLDGLSDGSSDCTELIEGRFE